ncbi:GDP-mannose 4,6-dehydratase [Acinetobacter faecalis]|uniref:GDP-mannose 4,6-dehydratase n=1 Tax=Acinetobacter faecalis TaxID=2665161 RepID=UPI002A90D539|nr:GDP-mannose 4,6-dehydratase [Acinetobacter faecalis]MDY6462186.1 GDP-mannose 4,6-dehydratase [Acinetobacter faecalis]
MNNRALIFGISGQDGSYLAKLLISKGYKVYGTSRKEKFSNLELLGIANSVNVMNVDIESYEQVNSIILAVNPSEIYYLASQSSVGLSFDIPSETIKSCILGLLNVLEVCRKNQLVTKIYNAGSSECFGDNNGKPITENSIFLPKSPYAIGKASSHWLIQTYRESYSIFACTGFLFNHESRLRPDRFVTKKIISTVKRIAEGSDEMLKLGQMNIYRDWGFAPEYVDAMWRILQQDEADDFVIATGKSSSLQDFVVTAFEAFDLDWSKHVTQSQEFFRPNELLYSVGDPSKAEKKLNWKAEKTMTDVVRCMIDNVDL